MLYNFIIYYINLSLFRVNKRPHQTQQTADFIDGSYAAKEAQGHGQGAHSDEDVGSHLHRV